MAAKIFKSLGYATTIAALALVGAATTSPAPADAKTATASACSSTAGKASKRGRGVGQRVKRARRLRRKCSSNSSGAGTGTGTSTGSGSQTSASSPPPPPTPPPDPPANPACPLSQTGSTIGMTLPSACTTVASDTASNPDPLGFWGRYDCENPTRHQQITSGGDGHATGLGTSQGNNSYRRLTVIDGDDYYGERCELGLNDMNGPTAFYRNGQRRVTFASIRLPNGTDPMASDWRTVLQMKQAQPYNNPNGSPVFEVQVRDGEWVIESSWNDLWSAPAQQNTWTRFAFDIVYSTNPSVGSITTYVDLNGDGDSNDSNEKSPTIYTATLRAETVAGGYSPYSVGQPIPSHLRAGIYQNPTYNCPSGCSVDVDNVQVVRA